MPGAQRPKVVRHTVQIVSIWRELAPRVVRRELRAARCARRERRGHVVGEVEAAERELDERLDLVREEALGGEPLEVDQQHGWQARERQPLRRFAECLAVRAVPMKGNQMSGCGQR